MVNMNASFAGIGKLTTLEARPCGAAQLLREQRSRHEFCLSVYGLVSHHPRVKRGRAAFGHGADAFAEVGGGLQAFLLGALASGGLDCLID
jgi:hypothetical protein